MCVCVNERKNLDRMSARCSEENFWELWGRG